MNIKIIYHCCFFLFFAFSELLGQQKDSIKEISKDIDILDTINYEPIVCNNYKITNKDCFVLSNKNDSIMRFEYIPFSDKFYSAFYDAKFEDGELIKRIVTMYTDPPGIYLKKRKSLAILQAAPYSSFLSCLVIDYLLENLKNIEKDLLEEKKLEEEIQELIKSGKVVRE